MNPRNQQREWVLVALDEFELPLVRYAARLLGDVEAARDVVQHVFLRLCDRQPAEIDGRLAAWLYTVCRNRAMDVLRAGSRQSSLEDSAGRGAGRVAGREVDPADSAEQNELAGRLRQLVARLPSSQCEAVGLWADGFSYREIAGILDRQEGHVRVLVHRGLKSLREQPLVRDLVAESAGQPRALREAETCRTIETN